MNSIALVTSSGAGHAVETGSERTDQLLAALSFLADRGKPD